MDRIKEALGLGPGTFLLKLDTPAIPAGGFVRGTYACKLKKIMDVRGVLARATATRGTQIVYEQTQRLDGQPNVAEARWTLVFRIPREIQLENELLPSELRELVWTISTRIELGLKSDPESLATFEVVGAFPDGVPVVEPGEGVAGGTSLERVVNVLAADTVSAANRVSERIVAPHSTPSVPDYAQGMVQSSLAAELAAARDAQAVRDKLESARPPDTYRTQELPRQAVSNPHETQELDPRAAPSPHETQILEPPRKRIEKPKLRLDEPIRRRGEKLELRVPPSEDVLLSAEPARPKRVEKPPLRVDEPIRRHGRQDDALRPRLASEAAPSEETPRPRRVEKPPIRVDEPIRKRGEQDAALRPRRTEKRTEKRAEKRADEPARDEEPVRPRRVEKPPIRVDAPIRKPSEEDAVEEPPARVEEPPVKRRVEKPPVQVNPRPSRMPQPSYESDADLRYRKPRRKK